MEQNQQKPGLNSLPFNMLHALLDNLRLVLYTIILGTLLLIGLIIIEHQPYYTVSSSLIFKPHTPELVYETSEGSMHSFEDWMRTQAHEIEKSEVLERAIVAFEDSGFVWRREDETMKTAVDRLRAKLEVSRINNTHIMTLDLGDDKKEGLAEIVNQVSNQYINYQAQQRNALDQKKLDYLRNEKMKYNDKIEDAYKQLMDISRSYGTAIADEKNFYVYLDMFIDLRTRYNKILTESIETFNRLEALKNQKNRLQDMTVYDERNTQTLLNLEQDINAKMLGLNKSSELYRSYHQMLSEIDSSNVKSARKFLVAAIDQEINAQTMAYESSKASEQDLKRELKKAQYEMMSINTAVLKTTTQRQAIDRIINIWDRITSRIEEIEIELYNPGRVRVLSHAETPEFPDPSKLKKKLFLGMVGVFGLGFGLAAAREITDKRVKRLADIERVIGFPATGFLLDSREEGIPEANINRIFSEHPRSYMTELFNQIAVKIEKEHESFESQVFTLTSLKGKSGVTSAAQNILSMLDADKTEKILVDLNSDNLSSDFSDVQGGSGGLINWLARNRTLEDGILRTADGHFDLLSMGSLREMDISRIRPSAVRELISRLKKQYKYIFIDGPPVLMTSETQTVSRESDVTMLIVDSQADTWPELMRSVNILNKIDAKVVSIILNKVTVSKGGYFRKTIEAHQQRYKPVVVTEPQKELLEV